MSAPTLKDAVASMGVFVIALPLSLGIALASGMPPASGLIAAIVGGIVVGLLAGAPLVVSGPAAGLAALVFQFVQQYGLVGLGWITVIAGGLQIALGALRSGFVFNYVPRPVLEGMLAAIGLIIAVNQIFVFLGFNIPESVATGFLELMSAETVVVWPILLTGAFALLCQLYWPKIFPSLKMIPGALPAVILASLAALPFEMPRVELAPLVETVGASFGNMMNASLLPSLSIYILPAIGLALVASAESLLTARAIQGRVPQDQRLDLNQELIAQGVGNMTCGAIGGAPITGVIVRSSANIDFGAKTRWSSVMHGVWLVLFCLAMPFVLKAIPLTVLASVLIVTGFKLLNPSVLLGYLREDKKMAAMWVFTVVSIVTTDLLTGLSLAILFAILANIRVIVPRVADLKKSVLGKRRSSTL